MKVIKYLAIFSIIAPLLIVVLIAGMAGGVSGGTEAISPPATEEQTSCYKFVGSELGTPWDIILLADAILADQKGLDSIEDYNAILTSLQFCIIQEIEYVWKEYEESSDEETSGEESEEEEETEEEEMEEDGADNDSSEEGQETDEEDSSEDTSEETEDEESGEWIYNNTAYYRGKNQILAYLGVQETDISYTRASSLATEINNIAANKSDGSCSYVATITVNSDYESILRYYINLDEENIKNVMELYNSRYLIYLYGYDDGVYDMNIQLPELHTGNVLRSDLARVAVSLINFPYMLGGKSPSEGVPINALDCSGYVDWVFMQCFGQCISGMSSGTEMQFYSCSEITADELMIGDLGFYFDPANITPGQVNHVGIYIGKINGVDAFIHCGGESFGYEERPRGRVGISINSVSIANTYNNITGSTFAPAMPGTNFKYFRRPQFLFID